MLKGDVSCIPSPGASKKQILAARSAHEAMAHDVRIEELSRREALHIGCVGQSPLERVRPRAWHVKGEVLPFAKRTKA